MISFLATVDPNWLMTTSTIMIPRGTILDVGSCAIAVGVPMLASLLPGLRDVRTPLTVGYLWLLILWLAIGDKLPTTRPAGDGLVARLFDLEGLLGKTVAIAALGFVAYVLGALLTIPVEASPVSLLLRPLGTYSRDTRLSSNEYLQHQEELMEQIRDISLSESDGKSLGRLMDRQLGFSRSVSDLRARLLVANQEMYGEYDRLAAEAAFRINLFPPMIAIAALIIIARDVSLFLGLGVILAAVMLLMQGANRLGLSTAVLRRAVVSGVIDDQIGAKIKELVEANKKK